MKSLIFLLLLFITFSAQAGQRVSLECVVNGRIKAFSTFELAEHNVSDEGIITARGRSIELKDNRPSAGGPFGPVYFAQVRERSIWLEETPCEQQRLSVSLGREMLMTCDVGSIIYFDVSERQLLQPGQYSLCDNSPLN